MTDLLIPEFFSLERSTHHALFHECRYPWEALNQLKQYILSLPLGKIEVDIPAGVSLIDPEFISIGPGSVIEPGAYIKGPCVIGANCTVRHAAYLRGDVLVGSGCTIGHASEAKHSIFLDRSKAAHFAYVGDSILGHDANLGAGTRCANLRLDGREVWVRKGEDKIATGRRKLGAIIGDRVQTGCNAVCNPGTLLPADGWVLPCSVSSGYVTNEKKLKV